MDAGIGEPSDLIVESNRIAVSGNRLGALSILRLQLMNEQEWTPL